MKNAKLTINKVGNGSNVLLSLTPKKLREAADIKDKIKSLENRLVRLVKITPDVVAPVRQISAVTRRRMSLARKRHLAKQKREKIKA